MSQAEIQRMVGKALIDEMFRRQLLTDPARAIQKYAFQLDPEELALLQRQNRPEAEALAAELDRRICESGWNGPREAIGFLRP